MLTYTQALDKYKRFTVDKTSENATFGADQLNSGIKKRLGESDWMFLEKVRTSTTVASQQGYWLPADFGQMRTVTVTQGTTVWTVTQAPSRRFWDLLNTISYTSTIAQYYYIIGNRILVYPTPSASGNTITYNYKKKIQKLSVADYTTGTISITNSDETVTGAGTTFTTAMAGLSLITTDGLWYDVASFTSTTSLELAQPYLGLTIAGATYTIGQMSPIPDAYEDMPVYDAAADYYRMKGNKEKADYYTREAEMLAKKMKSEQTSKDTSPRIRTGESDNLNPNLYIRI